MPKDASKNIDRYKIRGGDINEYEFHENQEFLATKGTSGAKKPAGVKKGAAAKKAGRKTTKK